MRENQYLESPMRLTTGDVLSQKDSDQRDLIYVSSDATIGEAIELMREHGISQLPVISNGEILGGLGERYLLKLLLSNSEAWHHTVLAFIEDPFPVVPANPPVDDLVSFL